MLRFHVDLGTDRIFCFFHVRFLQLWILKLKVMKMCSKQFKMFFAISINLIQLMAMIIICVIKWRCISKYYAQFAITFTLKLSFVLDIC